MPQRIIRGGGGRRIMPLSNRLDGARWLAAKVVHLALQDASKGKADAAYWLDAGGADFWLSWLEVDGSKIAEWRQRWPGRG